MREFTLDAVLALLPERRRESNKGDYGMLLSFAGSSQYRGAALLSSLGALRCGVGLLRLASVERVIAPVCSALPEVTFLPLGDGEVISLRFDDVPALLERFPRMSACLCGCGLGAGEQTRVLVRALLECCAAPLVLDADALNVLESETHALKRENRAAKALIITPHVGEFSRLSGLDVGQIKSDPAGAASRFSDEFGCVTVLKDHHTVIASPGGEPLYSSVGNAGLARGGSGDILAGMIASFAAQGLDCTDAAACGVYLHGAAADRCANRLSKRGMLPHDILGELCGLFCENGQ